MKLWSQSSGLALLSVLTAVYAVDVTLVQCAAQVHTAKLMRTRVPKTRRNALACTAKGRGEAR